MMNFILLGLVMSLLAAQDEAGVAGGNIADLQIKAAQGDSDVAIDLFHYFLTKKNDPTEASFWLRVSAEQGSCYGMIEYGRLLGGALQRHDEREAWFAKASGKGCDMSYARRHEDSDL